jgi:hypothetical protein
MRPWLPFLLVLSLWAQSSVLWAQPRGESDADEAEVPRREPDSGTDEDGGGTPEEAGGQEEAYDYYSGETEWDAELADQELLWDAELHLPARTVKQSIQEDKRKGGMVKAGQAESSAEDMQATSLAEPSTVSLADQEIEAPEGVRLPAQLGPVRIYVGDREDWIRIGLVTQLQYEHEQFLEGAGQEEAKTNTLEFRRLRTVLASSFLEGRIRSQLQLNLSPQALELIDLWLSFTRFRFASVRLGQFKIPFTRYRAQSFAALSFADWSPVTKMFGAERQFGLEASASGGLPNLEYALGIFTGQNARASHAVGLEEYYGETPQNPSELGDGTVFSSVDPALVGRVAKNFGKIDTDTNSDVVGGPLRHSLGLSLAWTARPEQTVDLPVRLALEWLGKLHHFDVNAVAYLGWFERWTNGELGFGSFGLLAEAGYRITSIFEVATRYSLVYYSNALQDDAAAYAQFQIDEAEDPMQAAVQYAGVGELIASQELSLAASAHIIGNSLKTILELDWIPLKVDQGRQDTLAITLLLQLQF